MSFIVSMGSKAEPLVRIFKGETLKLCEKGDKIMNLVKNFFSQLSPAHFYHILQARSDIFVMEQNCVYRDIDGLDFECIHIFFEDENSGKVLAYLRAFRKDSDTAQIGRVLSAEHGKGLGGKILSVGVETVKELFKPKSIIIEAQCYAIGYYAREGFKVCSEEFMEDDIPHVYMKLNIE